GVFLCSQAAARVMRGHGGGRIVNVASIYGLVGPALHAASPYAATKSGVVGLTRALAIEWAAEGIRVNAVAPTHVRTEMTRARVAIVTGGGGALGGAIAQGLAEFGARVVLADLDAALAKTAASGITGATADVVDVTDPASATALAERVQGAFGRIDILINAAGIFRVAPALELSMADWDAVLRVNLTGIFVMTRAVAPHMLARRRGNVVNITSVSSVVANPGY